MLNQEVIGGLPPAAPGEPHLACVLLLDTSGSMSGPPIVSLNNALQNFRSQVSMDEMAKKRVDIAVVEFNDTVRVVQDFVPIMGMEPITLEARGVTAMGAGVNKAIDLVKERNRVYSNLGTPCFKPWIFMITDGEPTDSIEEAASRVQAEESKGTHGKLKFWALGVSNYNQNTLRKFTDRVIELKDTNFAGIFDWMAQSMVTISVSRIGDNPPVPTLPENARKANPDRDIGADWD
jgi:uncharacterized protein YegL